MYRPQADTLGLVTAGSESMRIDSSGNLLVGTTQSSVGTFITSTTDEGMAYYQGSVLAVNRDSGNTAIFNRQGTDGSIVEFYKDGSTVGSIRTDNGNLVVGFGNSGIKFGSGASAIVPHSVVTEADSDAAIDIGTAAGSIRRFRDLYLSGGVYLGGTGSANHLDDYEEGTWTPAIAFGSHTYTQQYGWYCKVGNVVHCYAQIGVSSRGSSTVELGISGLPFTEAGDNTQSCPFGFNNRYGQSQLLSTTLEAPTTVSVETAIAFIRNWKNTGGSYTVNSLNSSGSMSISFTYLVDA
jgi:hypothetical protein